MAVNKTLYVRDEDAPIWDKAKEVIGDSLSSYLTTHLRAVVTSHKAVAHGNERILLTFREGGLPRTKAFYGHWLIHPDKPFEQYAWDSLRNEYDMSEPPTCYAVALTAKGRVAVFEFYNRNEDGTFGQGVLRSFDSFEKANADREIPGEVIAEAMEVNGVPIEELDI